MPSGCLSLNLDRHGASSHCLKVENILQFSEDLLAVFVQYISCIKYTSFVIDILFIYCL